MSRSSGFGFGVPHFRFRTLGIRAWATGLPKSKGSVGLGQWGKPSNCSPKP